MQVIELVSPLAIIIIIYCIIRHASERIGNRSVVAGIFHILMLEDELSPYIDILQIQESFTADRERLVFLTLLWTLEVTVFHIIVDNDIGELPGVVVNRSCSILRLEPKIMLLQFLHGRR